LNLIVLSYFTKYIANLISDCGHLKAFYYIHYPASMETYAVLTCFKFISHTTRWIYNWFDFPLNIESDVIIAKAASCFSLNFQTKVCLLFHRVTFLHICLTNFHQTFYTLISFLRIFWLNILKYKLILN